MFLRVRQLFSNYENRYNVYYIAVTDFNKYLYYFHKKPTRKFIKLPTRLYLLTNSIDLSKILINMYQIHYDNGIPKIF